jgi:ferredoxin like protein
MDMDNTLSRTGKPNGSTPADNAMPQVYIDDMLMSLKYFIDEHDAHLMIISADVCVQCKNKACLTFCPVGAYKEDEAGRIQIAHQSCIECGSCRVMCPHSNVSWKNPRGGFGVAYKFG